MVMVKVNSSKIFSDKLGIAVGIVSMSALALLSLCGPVYGGPQSLLDPYATIQPPATQTEAKPLGNQTSTKKPHSSDKLKAARSTQKSRPGQLNSTTKSASTNSGFLSGVKEIQHGYMTTFKAAGHGIMNGSKSAGAKIASGGGKVKDGLSAAGHKIISGPKALVAKTPVTNNKKKNQAQSVATANSNGIRPGSALDSPSPLPGKPLGPVANTLPHAAKVKTPAVGKKNFVARTFDKFNIFAKHKPKNPDIAANNQKTGG